LSSGGGAAAGLASAPFSEYSLPSARSIDRVARRSARTAELALAVPWLPCPSSPWAYGRS
jgi:hypothetical protein